ncbi:phosphatidylglycerophosphatase B [Paenibacillus baekrokdamisoli]|uniref:Phosphatidylglycerophosphatase B n=1 Tax=Paenibacillus baekrokdamisoli TaxID=1712516 RepID=A0A3G9JK63_9BACL|nr:phosphatase PAP2 family protein [Paenibacillus baekrokdamisoli]MBB3071461.1 undecaprenyl-diphosphatase [Paenibacillus baekrokdamisoli]BBH24508.1 phosphatidylglycerophosphatase B [Paenibacillus baekrokdamisoli]
MWLLVLLVAIAGFEGLSILVSRNQLKQFDASIIDVVQGWESPTLTKAAKLLSAVGSSSVTIPLIIVVAVVLFIVLKHRKELILLIGGMLGSTLLNELLKRLYHRARPDIHRIIEQEGFSFPSGHSMAAFTFYGLMTFLLWRHLPSQRWRIALLVFSGCMILSIGLSRIYLGVHYPSDVIGGYWISACWIAVCIRLFRRSARVRESN